MKLLLLLPLFFIGCTKSNDVPLAPKDITVTKIIDTEYRDNNIYVFYWLVGAKLSQPISDNCTVTYRGYNINNRNGIDSTTIMVKINAGYNQGVTQTMMIAANTSQTFKIINVAAASGNYNFHY